MSPSFASLFSVESDEMVNVLNPCLEEVMDWMRANKLKLSSDKAEVLLVDYQANLPDLDGTALLLRNRCTI